MAIQRLLLELELRRWAQAGRRARLWWRDDDARAPSRALRRLLALADAHSAPLTLAVIPDSQPQRLAPLLAGRADVRVIQHGVTHCSHRDGPAAGEFATEATREDIIHALRAGWAALRGLPGLFPAFAPPWNDIHPALPAALRSCGFVGLSGWGELSPAARPFRIDTHIDLMRWRDGPRFRGRGRFQADLRAALALRRREGRWDAPIGLLTHHLAQDEAAWAFLAQFLAWSRARAAFEWTGIDALVAGELLTA
ncbi:polysaccharide deacetylase [Phenylobacterium sp.]|uniref:polysaccharide deacetylase n=1 Tax=Phenylobacterium sp. TaxID=1871053 RepID=UPI002DF55AF1|nr:polysaccharide deacetylase [Phenylobacterium sp.]